MNLRNFYVNFMIYLNTHLSLGGAIALLVVWLGLLILLMFFILRKFQKNTASISVGIITGVFIGHYGLIDGIMLGLGLFGLVKVILGKLDSIKQN